MLAPEDAALYPEILVVCACCGDDVTVAAGLNAVEAAWMHEHECRLRADQADLAEVA